MCGLDTNRERINFRVTDNLHGNFMAFIKCHYLRCHMVHLRTMIVLPDWLRTIMAGISAVSERHLQIAVSFFYMKGRSERY